MTAGYKQMHSYFYFLGDTIHLSNIDMIAGTPVLDIKPYIPEYDSPHTRMGMDSQPYDSNTDQPTASLDETTDTLNIREDADAQSDLECEKPDDFGSKGCEADVPVTDSAKVCAQFSLHKALEGVKAYVTHDDLRQVSCEGKDQVSDSPKIKPPELTAEHPCYGEEAYSTIAGWIREPPVGSLEVRFTPHAERELAEFLPTHLSGKADSYMIYDAIELREKVMFVVLFSTRGQCYEGDEYEKQSFTV